jgi:hypothetical protein
MQFFYGQANNAAPSEDILKTMMGLLGTFLLEIRRSMGNETTRLSNLQMLEWFMQDARRWRGA